MSKLICLNCHKIMIENIEKWLENNDSNYLECPYCYYVWEVNIFRNKGWKP